MEIFVVAVGVVPSAFLSPIFELSHTALTFVTIIGALDGSGPAKRDSSLWSPRSMKPWRIPVVMRGVVLLAVRCRVGGRDRPPAFSKTRTLVNDVATLRLDKRRSRSL